MAPRAEFLYSTEAGPQRRLLHFLLPSGEYRNVLVAAAHDVEPIRSQLAAALGADNVVTKGEAVRRGWRSRVDGSDGSAA